MSASQPQPLAERAFAAGTQVIGELANHGFSNVSFDPSILPDRGQRLAHDFIKAHWTPGGWIGLISALPLSDLSQADRDAIKIAIINGIECPSNPSALRSALSILQKYHEGGRGLPSSRFFYDGTRYYLDTGAEYVPMDQRSVNRHCKKWGMSRDEIEDAICDIQTQQFISFAGPLAGQRRGLIECAGHKLLALNSPQIIEASPGEWPTLKAVIDGLLLDDELGEQQVKTFYGWLKGARESLLTGRRRPGQALALAGPRQSGKSLLIDLAEIALGGRRANPYQYFSGKSNFNADLAGAELLAVDDEAGSTDIRSRRDFAAAIKANLFSGSVRIEGKHKTPFIFRPCWRLILALNDEPEALLVLPPITEDLLDKIILFRCHKREMPMPSHTMEDRERFFRTLRDEMPGFLDFLENWEIPPDMTEDRCGVKHLHHPAILQALGELSPEGQLVSLIDAALAAGSIALPWEGQATELKAILCAAPSIASDAKRLLESHIQATGTYLGRLAQAGDRVTKLPLRNGIQRWKISQVDQWINFLP